MLPYATCLYFFWAGEVDQFERQTYVFPNSIGLFVAHFSHSNYSRIKNLDEHYSGQISSRPHRISPQKVAEEGKFEISLFQGNVDW